MASGQDFIFELPLPLIAAVLLIALVAADAIGARLRLRIDRAGAKEPMPGQVLAGTLGLLGLLLAFTFSLTLNRYDLRRDMLVNEANAIGTALIRAELLAPSAQGELIGKLEAYAQLRLRFGLADFRAKEKLAADSALQRQALAAAAVTAALSLPPPLGVSLLASINEVIDTGSAREAALKAHAPQRVLLMLFLVTAAAAFVLGFDQSTNRRRFWPAHMMLFVLLTAVVYTILDLDSPRRGAITISQAPMEDLVASFSTRP
jgi:hypothetical protein